MIQRLQHVSEISRTSVATEPILMCAADDNYVRPLAVTLHSAAQNLRDNAKINAIVLDGGISDEHWVGLKETLAAMPIDVFSLKPGFDDVQSLGISHHITHTAYLRLLAGRLLPNHIDKIIYLDSDLLICDDIAKLWDMPLQDDYALAVPDVACPFVDSRFADCNFRKSSPYLAAIAPIANWKALDLNPAAPYFNSGVMVLNVARMREEQIERALLQCLHENSRYVWCWDQYALNVVFANAWQPISLKWNQGAHVFEFPNESFSPLNADEFLEARDKPSIIHFTTEWKPWDYANRHPLKDLFYQQLDQTAFAHWRPEKPNFSFAQKWQATATAVVKQTTIFSRKVSAPFRGQHIQPDAFQLPEFMDLPVLSLPTEKTVATLPKFSNQLTLFAVPKPFAGDTAIAQFNAISSWRQLDDFANVVLVGDEKGTAEVAHELQVRHISNIETNFNGTPLLSDVFKKVHQVTTTPYLAYCNCDIILFDDFEHAVTQLIATQEFDQFVATGVRTNADVNRRIDFDSPEEVLALRRLFERHGQTDALVCKDYFVFSRELYRSIPKFAVGRGNWDNWMLHNAKANKIPVVSLGRSVLAGHQNHDYLHAGNRMKIYATGDEARENQRLAGGRHLISGSTSDFSLVNGQLRPNYMKSLAAEFWFDFPRFVGLLMKIVGRHAGMD